MIAVSVKAPVAIVPALRACSSAWLERIPDKDEVPGSNPGRPTVETPCTAGGFSHPSGSALPPKSSRVHIACTPEMT